MTEETTGENPDKTPVCCACLSRRFKMTKMKKIMFNDKYVLTDAVLAKENRRKH